MAASRLGLPSYSSIDHASTVRPCATSLLTINSDDRFADYPTATAASDPTTYNISPYSFTINKAESLLPTPPTRLAVTEAAFQWTIPNINTKTNKILVSYSNGGPIQPPVTITLNGGFYTPAQLAVALQNTIITDIPALAGLVITYGIDSANSSLGPPVIAPTNSPIFEYTVSNINTQTIAFSPLPGIPRTQKQLFNLLGFNSDNSIQSPFNQGGSTFCQAINYVDIVCTQLTALQGIRDTTSQSIRRDALCRLYVTNPNDVSNVPCSSSTFCPPGCQPFTLYRTFAIAKQIQWIPNQPLGGNLTFIVYSDDGTPLSESDTLPGTNYSDWSITILLSEN